MFYAGKPTTLNCRVDFVMDLVSGGSRSVSIFSFKHVKDSSIKFLEVVKGMMVL